MENKPEIQPASMPEHVGLTTFHYDKFRAAKAVGASMLGGVLMLAVEGFDRLKKRLNIPAAEPQIIYLPHEQLGSGYVVDLPQPDAVVESHAREGSASA